MSNRFPLTYPGVDLDEALYEALSGEPEHASPYLQVGNRDSGTCIVRPDASPVPLLTRKGLPQISTKDGQTLPTMPGGVAVVHVHFQDFADAITPVPSPIVDWQQKLILRVRWQNGNAGGDAQVDVSRGTIFSLGGVHSVEADAVIVDPNTNGPPVIPGPAYRVEAGIFWKSAVQPKDCFMTTPRILLAAGIESALFEIPKQAKSMLVMTTVPASAPGMILRLYWNNIAAGPTLAYRTDNPMLNGTPIWAGVNFFSVQAAAIMTVTPGFELCL